MREMDARPATAGRTRRPLPDELARHLQQQILAGVFAPGDKLPPERELARQLGVNRGSLREALKKLEQLRLVTIQQGSGVRVRPLEEASFELVRVALEREDALDPAWADDLRQVRGALLPLATRLALERARAGDRTQLLDLLRRAADPGLAPHEFARAWRQVEARLVTLSGNRVLVMLLSSFQGPVESPSPRRRVPLLRRFAVAVEAGDAVMARRILRDLLRHIGGPEKGGDTPSG